LISLMSCNQLVYQFVVVYLLMFIRQGAFTCVGWQLTLFDPIWQVMLRDTTFTFIFVSG